MPKGCNRKRSANEADFQDEIVSERDDSKIAKRNRSRSQLQLHSEELLLGDEVVTHGKLPKSVSSGSRRGAMAPPLSWIRTVSYAPLGTF